MRYFILVCAILLSLGFFYEALTITDWLFSPKKFNIFKYLLRALLFVASLYFLWKSLLFIVYTSRNNITENILSIAGSFITLLVLCEIVFSFIPISLSGGNVLVSKTWINLFWNENYLGYRDENPLHTDIPNHKNIFIVGDSYVAGHGIENEDDRFSELLEKELDECLDIFNLGKSGADTFDEYQFLKSYPIKPDMIIVVHVNNDIYSVADKKTILSILNPNNKFALPKSKITSSKNFIVVNSFFFNFLDNIFVELKKEILLAKQAKSYNNIESFLTSDEGKFVEMSFYRNDSLFNMHLKRINFFVDYSRINNIPLLFVLFPKLDETVIDYTDRTANQPLTSFLTKHNVDVINLTQDIKKITKENRRSGKFDPHPGNAIQELVAIKIKNHLLSSDIIKNICN